jgi:hypothetical protein
LTGASRNISVANAVPAQGAATSPTKTAKVHVAGLWSAGATTKVAAVGSQILATATQAAKIHAAGLWPAAAPKLPEF